MVNTPIYAILRVFSVHNQKEHNCKGLRMTFKTKFVTVTHDRPFPSPILAVWLYGLTLGKFSFTRKENVTEDFKK